MTYAYDAFNNMIGRQEFLAGFTTADKSEHYLYDTSVAGSNQLVLKLADDGAVMNRYLWGPAIDMLLAQEDGAGGVLSALGSNEESCRDLFNRASSPAILANKKLNRPADADFRLASAIGARVE